uniref:Uncharacterized protein n=1 Tax=Cannabis sativa TaxID=3483 RepID=A0A803Q6I3_CANSA
MLKHLWQRAEQCDCLVFILNLDTKIVEIKNDSVKIIKIFFEFPGFIHPKCVVPFLEILLPTLHHQGLEEWHCVPLPQSQFSSSCPA